MASQSPFSRNSTAFPRIKQSDPVSVSSSSSYSSICCSSSLCNSSMFLTSHTTPPKRNRIVFSSSSSSSSGARRAKQKRMKSVELDSLSSGSKSNAALVGNSDGNRSQSQKMQYLSFKSLFGSRALWRRILFASRKVRSIILLNVIAVVYGNYYYFLKSLRVHRLFC